MQLLQALKLFELIYITNTSMQSNYEAYVKASNETAKRFCLTVLFILKF